MADLTGTSQWKLNTEEVGYMVDEDSLSQDADSYKVYVPNVLPLVEQGDALETPSPLDTSCFINDGECTIHRQLSQDQDKRQYGIQTTHPQEGC